MKSCEDLEYSPKKNQLKFAAVFLDTNGKKSRIDIAKEVGIHHNTITNWFKDAGFVKWINSKKDEMLDSSLADRYKVAIRKALLGDFQCLKLLFEMEGEYVPRSESQVTNLNKTDLDDMNKEDLIDKFSEELERYRGKHKSGRTPSKDKGSAKV